MQVGRIQNGGISQVGAGSTEPGSANLSFSFALKIRRYDSSFNWFTFCEPTYSEIIGGVNEIEGNGAMSNNPVICAIFQRDRCTFVLKQQFDNLTEQTAKKQVKDTELLNELIIDAIQDIKGKHIVKLDLRKLEDASADFFIICEGDSTTQVKAIADNVYQRIKDELGVLPAHREGVMGARWVLVDYFDTVVHVFHPETRAFYDLEDLWSDASITEFENL